MCPYVSSTKPKPEQELSDLIMEGLGVRLTPNEIRLFLKLKWKEIAVLAHRIHEA